MTLSIHRTTRCEYPEIELIDNASSTNSQVRRVVQKKILQGEVTTSKDLKTCNITLVSEETPLIEVVDFAKRKQNGPSFIDMNTLIAKLSEAAARGQWSNELYHVKDESNHQGTIRIILNPDKNAFKAGNMMLQSAYVVCYSGNLPQSSIDKVSAHLKVVLNVGGGIVLGGQYYLDELAKCGNPAKM